MIRKLLNCLALLRVSFFKKLRKTTLQKLPEIIDEKERLCRAVFSPMNLDKKGNLKPNCFRTPPEKDEVSVNRLAYTEGTFCKTIARKNEKPDNDRNYHGFAIITQNEVLQCDCSTIYSPILLPHNLANIFHADILLGYIPKKGEPLPSKIQKKINDMVKCARFYQDPNPKISAWTGPDLI